MSSVNLQILIGNLGSDPDLRYTTSGKAVCTFGVATSEKSGDKEYTTWHNIVAWEKLADICSKYLKKGSKVYIQGRTNHRSYDDRDGNKKNICEVIAHQVQFLTPAERSRDEQPTQSQRYTSEQEAPFNPDDDIPF